MTFPPLPPRFAATLLPALLVPIALAAAPAGPVLSGPEVTKLDWNTRALTAADLDGDGLRDLVVINNDRAALELLFQRVPGAPLVERKGSVWAPSNRWEPRLEDARFRRETLVVGQTLFDLAAADFDGDGHVDLAMTGEPDALRISHGGTGAVRVEKVLATAPAPVKFTGCLAAGDVDADGRADLVMLGLKEIAVYRQRAGSGLTAEERIPLGDENAYGLQLADFDGDGRIDLGYLVAGVRESFRVRLQLAGGKFGPERAFALKTPRSPLVAVRGPKGLQFASALGVSGQAEFVAFSTGDEAVSGGGFVPQAFTPLAGARGPALYTTGDFNRDGASDLATTFGENAQIFVYLRQPDGGFGAARRVPSLTDDRALASGPAPDDAGDRLYVLSGKENALAEIRFGADGKTKPPRTLPLPGRLITMAASAFEPDGKRPGIAVVAEEEGKRVLSLWERDETDALEKVASVVLAGLRADPRAIILADLDQDGRADVVVAIPSLGLRIYLRQPDGSLSDAAANPVFRPGLLGRPEMATAPLALADADGDGKAELLVAAENFLRAVRIAGDGGLEIVAQFDARDSAAEITTGFVLPGRNGDAAGRVLLHDRKGDQFHWLERPAEGGAPVATVLRPVARIEVTGAQLLTGPGGRRELWLQGKDRFWWMPEQADSPGLKILGAYASDLPDTRYQNVIAGDFDGDACDELVAVDTERHTVEILGRDADGAWGSRLHFRVFETDPHYEGNRGNDQEPRDLLVTDVTGDGRADLVLLVHDRVLVYPGE
jgi:hypothetical protein